MNPARLHHPGSQKKGDRAMDLTGEDIWMLLCVSRSISSRELATSHGLPLAQMMRVCLQVRREG